MSKLARAARAERREDLTATRARLPGTCQLLQRLRAESRIVGGQLYVWQGHEVVVDVGFGLARPGVPMTASSLTHWFCCTKPLLAVAFGQLVDRGLVSLADPVGNYLAPFADGGKEAITIAHLLTHTSGLRHLNHPRPFLNDEREILGAIGDTDVETGWIPGSRAAYQPFCAWYVLGAVLRAVTGQPVETYLADNVLCLPGMEDSWLAVPAGKAASVVGRLARPHVVGPKGLPVPVSLLTAPSTLALVNPASGAIGPVRALGALFQALLCPRPGEELLSPATAGIFLSPQRRGLVDETFQLPWDWGLGFATDLGYLCPEVRGDGFGHMGGAVLVVSDRLAGRVSALALNGVSPWGRVPPVGPGTPASLVMSAIYRDLDGDTGDPGTGSGAAA